MNASRKSEARRKLSRRSRPLTVLQRLKRLEFAFENLPKSALNPMGFVYREASPASPRFTNLDAKGKPTSGDHVAVFDKLTGLVWSAEPLQGGKDLNHADAMKVCQDLTLLGVKTWRAPTIQELLSIVDYELYDPAVPTTHFKGPYGYTWSSTLAKAPAGCAWDVGLDGGNSDRGYQSGHGRVRAVCAGQQFGLSV
jgi:hypothetical protein